MQMLRRLTTLLVVLAFGVGMMLQASAAPNPMMPDRMGVGSLAVTSSPDGAGNCSNCDGVPGMTQNCLPSCLSVPAFVSAAAIRILGRDHRYDPAAERSFAGADSRPEPYPPRPAILS